MCGRLTLKTSPDRLIQFLLPWVGTDSFPTDYAPRFNIAPTQSLLAIVGEGLERHLIKLRWGLIPPWATDLSIGNRMINARHETLLQKRSFIGPLANRRCAVIADGYYEWQALNSKTKQAYWITPRSTELMLLAGLWEKNQRATGQTIESCTLITTQANPAMNSIHDRMPMPLERDVVERWLNPGCSAPDAYAHLRPVDDLFFRWHPVSPHVNNPRNDDAQCIQAIPTEVKQSFFEDE
jgi:putative SOS response-associated peptidase YedK